MQLSDRAWKLRAQGVFGNACTPSSSTLSTAALSVSSASSSWGYGAHAAPVVGCGMQAFAQLSGFNTLMYYSATLFKQIGFNQPVAVGLIVSGTNFLFTLFALKYIDIIGRRKIMLFSAPGMILGLTLASISFYCMSSGFQAEQPR